MIYTINEGFEWDSRKAFSNLQKHGIGFIDATSAFEDPRALLIADESHSTPGEKRMWLIGEAEIGLLLVVYTVRNHGRTWRLISARRAGGNERRMYEER